MSKGERPTIAAMQGDGFYNRHSSLQAAGIAAVLPLWQEVVRSVEARGDSLVIADYGSSQGHNSMLPIKVAIAELRHKTGDDRAIEVIHIDRPSNDFTSLFKALDEDPDSYMAGARAIFPSAIGRSYFDPIIPAGRVTLGWNTWTLHWMSRNPIDVPDQVFGKLSRSPAVIEAVTQQLASDWERFLNARAVEMRPGAKLLSLFVGDDGRHNSWRWVGEEFWGAVAEMGRAGHLSEREQLELTFPTCPRTLSEIEAPFGAPGQFAGLKIEHAAILQGPDPFWAVYQETGDAARLGQTWANMMRAVFAPTIEGALDPDRNKSQVLDELFARFAARVAANPKQHDHQIAVVVLGKR
jgi:hypothetical protein